MALVLIQGCFSPRERWQYLEKFGVVTLWVSVLVASSEWRAGMPLQILQRAGCPSQEKYPAQMSTALRLRNPDLW